MMKSLEDWLYSEPVKSFVFTHPYVVWGVLTIVISGCMLIPVMYKWPKKTKS